MNELIDRANPEQLRRLCRWMWMFFTGPLGKYVQEADWVRAARRVIGAG